MTTLPISNPNPSNLWATTYFVTKKRKKKRKTEKKSEFNKLFYNPPILIPHPTATVLAIINSNQLNAQVSAVTQPDVYFSVGNWFMVAYSRQLHNILHILLLSIYLAALGFLVIYRANVSLVFHDNNSLDEWKVDFHYGTPEAYRAVIFPILRSFGFLLTSLTSVVAAVGFSYLVAIWNPTYYYANSLLSIVCYAAPVLLVFFGVRSKNKKKK